jgi:hypothetical protein
LIIAAGHRALRLAGWIWTVEADLRENIDSRDEDNVEDKPSWRKQVHRYRMESKRRRDPEQWIEGPEGALDPCDLRFYPIEQRKPLGF